MATAASKYNCFSLSSNIHKEGYSDQIIELAKKGKASNNYHFLQKYIDKILNRFYEDIMKNNKTSIDLEEQSLASEYFISGSRGSGKTTILHTLKTALSGQKKFLIPDFTINLTFQKQELINTVMDCIEKDLQKQELVYKPIIDKFKEMKKRIQSGLTESDFRIRFNRFIKNYLDWRKKSVLVLFIDDIDLVAPDQIINFLKTVQYYLSTSRIKLFCFGDWENLIHKVRIYAKDNNHLDYTVISSFHEKVFPTSGIVKIDRLNYSQLAELNLSVQSDESSHLNEIKPFFENLRNKNKVFSVLGKNHSIFKTLFGNLNLRQLNQFIFKLEEKSRTLKNATKLDFHPIDNTISDIFSTILPSCNIQLDFSKRKIATQKENESDENTKSEFKQIINIFVEMINNKSSSHKDLQFDSVFSFAKRNLSEIDFALLDLFIQESFVVTEGSNCFPLMMIWFFLTTLFLKSDKINISNWIRIIQGYEDPIECSIDLIKLAINSIPVTIKNCQEEENAFLENMLIFPVIKEDNSITNELEALSTVNINGMKYQSVFLAFGTIISLLLNCRYNKNVHVPNNILEYLSTMKKNNSKHGTTILDLESLDSFLNNKIALDISSSTSKNKYFTALLSLLNSILPNNENIDTRKMKTLISELYIQNPDMSFLEYLPSLIEQIDSKQISYYDLVKVTSKIKSVAVSLCDYMVNSDSLNLDSLFLYNTLIDKYILNSSNEQPAGMYITPEFKKFIEQNMELEENNLSKCFNEDQYNYQDEDSIEEQIDVINQSLISKSEYFRIITQTKNCKWKYIIHNYFKSRSGDRNPQKYFVQQISKNYKYIYDSFILPASEFRDSPENDTLKTIVEEIIQLFAEISNKPYSMFHHNAISSLDKKIITKFRNINTLFNEYDPYLLEDSISNLLNSMKTTFFSIETFFTSKKSDQNNIQIILKEFSEVRDNINSHFGYTEKGNEHVLSLLTFPWLRKYNLN